MRYRLLSALAATWIFGAGCTFASVAGTALVTRAPTIDGTLDGSVQQMTGESVSINGSGTITGTWLVPGTPTIRTNGHPAFGGTQEGAGSTTPSGYDITVGGSASVGHIVARTDPHALPVVAAPPAPAGTRDVVLDAGGDAGDFATVRNLTAHGNAGTVAIPPGAYGDLSADAGASLVLGVAGSTTVATYDFQNLTLNGTATLDIVGPVRITVANGVTIGGRVGTSTNAAWLQLDVANGGLTLNGGSAVYAYVEAPTGTVIIDGNAQLIGGCASDRLTVNGGGLLQLLDSPPAVAQTAPADGTIVAAPGTLNLQAAASDLDGWVQDVAFFANGAKVGEADTAPYAFTWSNVPYSTYTLTAVATDNAGGTTASAPVTVIVDQPPTVSISAPAAKAVVTAPGDIVVQADAADVDGTVAKVEFFANGASIGESTAAPFACEWKDVPYGHYALTAVATDNLGISTTSAPVPIIVNQPPTVSLTAPAAGALFVAPAAVTLTAAAADIDGTVAKVAFFNGPTELGEVAGGSDATAAFTLPLTLPAGTYTLTAVATDNLGASTTSAPVRFIVDAPPTVAVTAPVSGAVITAPADVAFQVNATDSDGFVSKVEYFNGTTKLGESTTAPFSFTWPKVPYGRYTITAIATDNLGVSGAPASVSLVLNAPPTVALTAPANGAVIPTGTAVALTADASDPDGTEARVEFFDGTTTKVGEATAAPFTFTWTNVPVGRHTLTAEATDNLGATSTSAVATFTVDTPPVASAQALTVDAGTALPVTLAATDADGDPLTYTVVTPPAHGTLSGTAPTLSYLATSGYVGPDSFTFTVTDGLLAAATPATISIQVTSPGMVVNAGSDKAIVVAHNSRATNLIVVNNDEWTFSDTGFTNAPTACAFALNIASEFAGGKPGKFLVCSSDFGFTQTELAQLMTGAGHNWTVTSTAPTSLAQLQAYDGLFLDGTAVDNQLLISYVEHGGNVYVCGGRGDSDEALWQTFLQHFGLGLGETLPDVGTFPVTTTHPLLAGVQGLYYFNGNEVVVMQPADPRITILQQSLGMNLLAVWAGGMTRVRLSGSVSTPESGTVITSTWSQVSGPAEARFSSPNTPVTDVIIDRAGAYRFRLSASDGKSVTTDDVNVTVVENSPPTIDPGPTIVAPDASNPVHLPATVYDDGNVQPTTVSWTSLAGPGTVTFADTHSPATDATFSAPGVYVLKLTASDGLDTSNAIVDARIGVRYASALPAGVIGWWTADGIPYNIVNHQDDAQFIFGAQYGPGNPGEGFQLNGSGAAVMIPAAPELNPATGSGLSVEFWMRPTTISSDYYYFDWCDGGNETVRATANFYGRRPTFILRDTAGVDHVVQFTARDVMTAGTWQHLAFTYDQPSGVARIYYNGAVLAEQNIGSFTPKTTGDLWLASHPDNRAYNGIIDEFTLYNRALSPTEVAQIASAGPIGKPPLDSGVPPVVHAGPLVYSRLPGDSAALIGSVLNSGPGWQYHWTCDSPNVSFGNPAALSTTVSSTAPGLYSLKLTVDTGLFTASDVTEYRVGLRSPVLSAGPVCWWPLNNSPVEAVHGGNDMQLLNGASFVPGVVGSGAQIGDGDDLVVAPASPALNVGASPSGMSIEFWVRPVFSSDYPLFAWSNGTAEAVRATANFNGTRPQFILRDTAGVDHAVVFSARDVLTSGTWQHLAFTYDRPSGIARIYRNGILLLEQNVGSFTPLTTSDLYMGSDPANSGFRGDIDEVAVYDRALAPGDVMAIYKAGAAGRAPETAGTAPYVDAGPNIQLAGATAVAALAGHAYDDGLPLPLTTTWSLRDGPAAVAFGNPSSLATHATFTAPGTYLLQLAAYDGIYESDGLTEVRVGVTPVSLPSDASAWWPMNGSLVNVVTGGDVLELRSGADFTPGEVSLGLTPGSSGGAIIAPAGASVDVGSSSQGMTIEYWFKPVFTGDYTLFAWANGCYATANFNGTRPRFVIRDTTGTDTEVSYTASDVIASGNWQHAAFTYDRTTGSACIYINGQLLVRQNIGVVTPDTTGPLWIGSAPGDTSFHGTIDELTLYRRALTAAEVSTIFNGGPAGKLPPLVNKVPVVRIPEPAPAFIRTPMDLSAAAYDDGLPNPPGALTYQWSLVSGPGNVTFSAPTALTTTATFDTAGSYTVRLTASDSALAGCADVPITVSAAPAVPPSITIYQPASGVGLAAGTGFEIAAHASDSDGTIAKVAFYQGGTELGAQTAPAADDPTTYFWTVAGGLPVGNYTFTAVATDNSGVSTTSAPVTVSVIADPGPPTVQLAAPADTGRISAPTAVTGFVQSPLIAGWTLQDRLQPAEGQTGDAWTTLASGTSQVGTAATSSAAAVPGTLGTFDPTALVNGLYELRLTATDTAGRTVVAGPIALLVEGNLKLGVFSLAFEDLKVPLAGLPLTVTRTYDTRDLRVGDFGPGWRLALADVRVQKNRPLGTGWYQTLQSGNSLQFYYVDPVGDRLVTVTLPDGETDRFKLGAVVKNRVDDPDDASFGLVVSEGTLKFYPIGDTTATLEPLDAANQLNNHFYIWGTGDQDLMTGDVTDASAVPYNTSRFRLTTKDGTVCIVDEALGLLSMTDRNGNQLVVNRDAQNRVTSLVSTQNVQPTPLTTTVTIHRDATGRVDYIRDPAGHDLDYLYDAQGRLSSFTNRELNVTQFRYENASFPNYLTKVVDPRGVSAIRSEFDTAGKLIKQIDADGHETDFNHGVDSTGQFQKVTDRLGHATTYYYDDRGNITLKIDPLGAQTSYAYYPDSDRVEFETDPYGNVKSMAYDARGNVIVETVGASATEDPASPTTGHTTRTTYNAYSVPTSITDPDGRSQAFTYDAATNNLLTHTVGAGGTAPATTTYTYNADGTVKSVSDALGDITAYQYDTAFSDSAYPGAVKQVTITVTDPAGSAGSDPANAADTVLRVTRMLYDAQENQLAQIVTRHLPDGTAQDVVTRYVYDTENRLTATILPDGRVNETRYNAIGKPDQALAWQSVAAYQAKDTSQARVTSYGYDANGNQVSVTYPDGTNEQAAFDAENRKVWSQDQRGERTFYTYDADGRLLSTIYPDADDGVGAAAPTDPTDARLADNPRAHTVYDLAGRVTDSYDELGHRTQTVYYADGTADAGRRKQTVQYVTVAGKLTTPATTYQYDGAGNVRFVTDPRGNTVETQYDDQGRPTVVAYPATDENAATTVQTQYDALGRRTAIVDQEGKLTRYRYDGLGRLAEVRQYLDASLAASDADYHLAPTTTGVVSTRYTYDELGNEQTQIDALGRTTTFWTDALGRRTRRDLPKDPSDASVLSETLQYDGWGNLWKRTDFAGMTTTYGYDALNRLTSKTADPKHPSLAYSHAIAKIAYGYNAAGERTSATTYNADGTVLYTESTPRDERGRVEYKDTAAGRLDYTYYANNLLEDIVSSNAGGVNVGYRYDEANRLAHVDDDSSGTTLTTDYGYDAAGNLASVTQPNGVTHSYGYDTLNRLRTLTVSQLAAGATQPVTLHAYECKLYPSGHRHEVLEGAKTTTYTYDALYRLTQEAIAGDAHGNTGTIGYELDKVGNRLSRTSQLAALGSQPSLTYNARDWLNGDTYSPNGSTVTGLLPTASGLQPSGTDTYDFQDHLIVRTRADGSTVNLSYDADGNRIAKNILDVSGSAVSSTGYLVDTNNPTGYAQVLEETVNGVLTRVYTYGTGLISQSVVAGPSSPATSYYAYDAHGSVRELTDATGAVTDRYDYDAFGNLIYRSGTTDNAHLYCGEAYDADLGLYYLRARYLNTNSGRFWSMDSYEGAAGDPASLHHYNYAGGEPVTSLDPSGNFSLVEMAATTAVVSTVAMIAQPAIRPMVAGVVGYLAGNPDARYSLSSIGVYSESAQLLEALGIPPAAFSRNLLADAFTEVGTNALTSVVAGAAGGYFANGLAAFRRSAPVSLATESTPAEAITRGVQLNKAIGDATADAIASRYAPALREVPINTVGGVRRVDVLTLGERNVAIESKVGETVLDARIRQELARDWWLRRTGKVDHVIWEFTPSPITGQGGPSAPLLQMLQQLGFGVRQ